MSEDIGIGKLLGIIGVILMSLFLLIAVRNILSGSPASGNVLQEVSAGNKKDAQVVELSVKDFNYYPNTINLKYNVPAKIVVDTNKVKGCLQAISIPDFGIRKFVTAKDNIISFTPNKKGTFTFSCSMGMGFGKIIVS